MWEALFDSHMILQTFDKGKQLVWRIGDLAVYSIISTQHRPRVHRPVLETWTQWDINGGLRRAMLSSVASNPRTDSPRHDDLEQQRACYRVRRSADGTCKEDPKKQKRIRHDRPRRNG